MTADNLRSLVTAPFQQIHDAIAFHLERHPPQAVLGDQLEKYRGSGSGKSLVMLALIRDVLHIVADTFGDDVPASAGAAEFIAPYCRLAAKSFVAKHISHYEDYTRVQPDGVNGFLSFYRLDETPFGGADHTTDWAGLNICARIGSTFSDLQPLELYERTVSATISELVSLSAVPPASIDRLDAMQRHIAACSRETRSSLAVAPETAEVPAFDENLEELQRLRQEIEAATASLEIERQQISRQAAELQAERAEVETARTEQDAAQIRLEAERKQLEWQQQKLAELRKEHAEHLAAEQELLTTRKKELEAREQELSRLSTELQSEREKRLEERQILQNERSELTAVRQQLEADREALSASQAAAAEHQRQFGTLEAALAAQTAALGAREDQLAARGELSAGQERELAAGSQALAEREEQLQKRDVELSRREAALQLQVDEIGDREAALQRQVDEIGRRETDMAQREELLSTRTEELSQRESNTITGAQQLEEQLVGLSTQQSSLQADRDLLTQQLAGLEQERTRLADEREAFEAARTQFAEECQAMVARSEVLQSEQQSIAEQWAEIEARAAALEARERSFETEQHKLAELRTSLENELASLETLQNDFVLSRPDAPRVEPARPAEELFAAAETGDCDRIRAAIDGGANINARRMDESLSTALHLATAGEHLPAVRLLLELGADPSLEDAGRRNARVLAVDAADQTLWDALALFSATPSPDAIKPLLAKLQHGKSSVETRARCIQLLGEIGPAASSAVPAMLDQLPVHSRRLSQAIVGALKHIDRRIVSQQAIPLIGYVLGLPVQHPEEVKREWVAHLYAVRGDLHAAAGNWRGAIADYEDSLRLVPDPENVDWQSRADAYAALDQNGPQFALDQYRLGAEFAEAADEESAVSCFEQAIAADGKFPWAKRDLAWLFATSRDSAWLNAPRAIELAGDACRMLQFRNPDTLIALAAALARHGEFEAAVHRTRQAMELSLPESRDYGRLLNSFENGRPFTEGASADSEVVRETGSRAR